MKLPTHDELPMRRIRELWNWLPAFRAVAETENLRKAARYLALSPPALSRSLRLLEEAAGYPLFVRDGKRLRLNERGHALLVVLRRSMRAVDDALSRPSGGLRLFTPPAVASLLVPVLFGMQPGLVIRSQPLGMSPAQALLRGLIDVALLPQNAATSHKDVATAAVGLVSWGVFRGVAASPGTDVVDGPVMAVGVANWDAWPAERPRSVSIEVDDLGVAQGLAKSGLALAMPLAAAPKELVRLGPSWQVPFVIARRERDVGQLDASPAEGTASLDVAISERLGQLEAMHQAESLARQGLERG